MQKYADISGQKFGRLTVIRREENDKYGNAKWLCICECGNVIIAKGQLLRRGKVSSCGCLAHEVLMKRLKKHNLRGTRIYRIWSLMKDRCENPHSHAYKNYGGRGIKVCPEWHDFESFYSDMSETYSDDLTLDRIDVNGDYCKDNCRWATTLEQANNTRYNRVETVNGVTGTLSELCRHFGLNYKNVHHRLSRGATLEEAFNKPFRKSPSTKRAV